jgi:fucose 4-O-acetylase-like acetyltransferase
MPFFVLGLYVAKLKKLGYLDFTVPKRLVCVIVCIIGIVLSVVYLFYANLPDDAMNGANSYNSTGTGPLCRLILIATALCWIGFLFLVVPNIKIPFITVIGQNTLPVYLLHGFVVKILSRINFFHYSGIVNVILAVVISIAVLAVFGNKYVGKVFKRIF